MPHFLLQVTQKKECQINASKIFLILPCNDWMSYIEFISGRIIGLFRLSYLTPGLMAAGVTEVILEKEQDQNSDAEPDDEDRKIEKKTDKNNSSSKGDSKSGSKKSK